MDADRFSMPHEICTSQISPLKQMAPSPPRCFLVDRPRRPAGRIIAAASRKLVLISHVCLADTSKLPFNASSRESQAFRPQWLKHIVVNTDSLCFSSTIYKDVGKCRRWIMTWHKRQLIMRRRIAQYPVVTIGRNKRVSSLLTSHQLYCV